jgi:Flp pilus assembly protein TadB
VVFGGCARPPNQENMRVLRAIGVFLIVAWLVLWLFVKITFAAIHLLVLVGVAMLLFGFLKRGSSSP